MYQSPVVLKDRRIKEWLTLVEKEMRVTLAKLLASAVQEMNDFKTTAIDNEKYTQWVDKYQVLKLLNFYILCVDNLPVN
jgi:dynein heavy chain 1